MALHTLIKLDKFDEFVRSPENNNKSFEYVRGEIWEVVSNNYSSQIASLISFHIHLYMKTSGIKGHFMGADSGYEVGEERYIPDVGYISHERQAKPNHSAYNPLAPDLAVEVISPTDDEKKLRVKIANYLSQNVVVWVVNPDDETVEIYQAGQAVILLNREQMIDGSPVFPQLNLAVKDIFPALGDESE